MLMPDISDERISVIIALEEMDASGEIWDEEATWDDVAVRILNSLNLPLWKNVEYHEDDE